MGRAFLDSYREEGPQVTACMYRQRRYLLPNLSSAWLWCLDTTLCKARKLPLLHPSPTLTTIWFRVLIVGGMRMFSFTLAGFLVDFQDRYVHDFYVLDHEFSLTAYLFYYWVVRIFITDFKVLFKKLVISLGSVFSCSLAYASIFFILWDPTP